MSGVKNSPLNIRMKTLEKRVCSQRIPSRQPLIVRLDGVGFSRWVSFLKTKTDETLPIVFYDSVLPMFKKFNNVRMIYQASDEVNILFMRKRPNSQHAYGGKVYKLISIMPSFLTVQFNKNVLKYYNIDRPALFDARIIIPETQRDILDYFKWRWKFSVRNSVFSFAKECGFSKKVNGMTTNEVIEFLKKNNCDWYGVDKKVRYGQLIDEYGDSFVPSTANEVKDFILSLF